MEALNRLHQTVLRAHKVNPHLRFEVFIHKVDGLSDDTKIETQRDIHQRANDELVDAGEGGGGKGERVQKDRRMRYGEGAWDERSESERGDG